MSAVPLSLSCAPKFYGVYPATVDAVDEAGAVTVRLPWFHAGDAVAGARVAQLYAGNGYGAFFVPEVGDEVLVSFAFGDLTQPVVLGGLYNGEDTAATDRAGNRDEKIIRTRAGHELRLVDTPDDERVVIQETSGKGTIELVTDGVKVTVRGTDVTVEAEGKLVLKGRTVEIVAADKVTVSGTRIDLN